jgi:hypothetical protein
MNRSIGAQHAAPLCILAARGYKPIGARSAPPKTFVLFALSSCKGVMGRMKDARICAICEKILASYDVNDGHH